MLILKLKERLVLFDNRAFFYFSLSGLFATFGNGLNYISLSWLAYDQTNSINGVARMMFFLWVPSIIFAPILGILSDRYNRKTQIIISNLVRGLVIVSWVTLWHFGIEIKFIYLYALLGTFSSLYISSAVPFIQNIIPKDHLINANATIDMIYELGTIAGMALSGFILAYTGIKATLLIGGIFFIIAGFFNIVMTRFGITQNKSENQQRWWDSYISSLNYFRQNPVLFVPYMNQMITMVLLMTIPIVLVPYTREVLNADTKIFAILEALYSLGIFTGAIFSPILCEILSIRKTLAILLAIIIIGLIILSLNTNILIVFPVYFMIGVGLSSWALSISLSQLYCSSEYQGRLQATFNGIAGCFILGIYLFMTTDTYGISAQLIYFMQSVFATIGMFFVLFYKKSTI
ncbi:MFS transporter [Bartonella sp. B30(2025)]